MTTSPLTVFIVTVVAAGVVTLLVGRLGSVRRQIAALAVACAVLPLVAVLSTGAVMLERNDTLALLALAVGAGATVGVCGLYVGHRIARQVSRLRGAPEAIGGGDLTARASRGGLSEVDAVAAAINAMADRLEELLDARGRLVMWAGHDLRSPLASLRAMTEAIEDGMATPEEYAPRIRERVADLVRRVDDLFELARLDAGAAPLDLAPRDVAALVRAAADARRDEADRAGVALHTVLTGSPLTATVAETAVRRILDNLIGNALRHTPPGGSVTVTADAGDGEVVVNVDDTGEGLDELAMQRMFEPFWRADAARVADGAGVGLGLAIARSLVEAHGGRITGRTRPGGGASLCFTLPSRSPAPPPAPEPATAPASPTGRR